MSTVDKRRSRKFLWSAYLVLAIGALVIVTYPATVIAAYVLLFAGLTNGFSSTIIGLLFFTGAAFAFARAAHPYVLSKGSKVIAEGDSLGYGDEDKPTPPTADSKAVQDAINFINMSDMAQTALKIINDRMSETEAVALLVGAGHDYQIIERDGEPVPHVDGGSDTRFDLKVENGRVTEVAFGSKVSYKFNAPMATSA